MNNLQKSTVVYIDQWLNQHKPFITNNMLDHSIHAQEGKSTKVNFQKKNEVTDDDALSGMLIW